VANLKHFRTTGTNHSGIQGLIKSRLIMEIRRYHSVQSLLLPSCFLSKDLKTKTHGTVILTAVLHECETGLSN